MGNINFGAAFIMLAIFGGLVVAGIFGIVEWLDDDSIRSNEPIIPEIELVLENNVVDTVYVYRQP